MKPTLKDTVSIADDVLSQDVGSEVVILDLASEAYYGLDPVGAKIWSLLQSTGDLSKVYEQMLSEYEVQPAELETDLLAHVGKLMAAGLLKLTSPNQ